MSGNTAIRAISAENLREFGEHLRHEEKSKATIEKYTREAKAFIRWLEENNRSDSAHTESINGNNNKNKASMSVVKRDVLAYRDKLIGSRTPSGVNGAISAINSLLRCMGWHDLQVGLVRKQKRMFRSIDRELTRAEYQRLLEAARQTGNRRMWLLMQTICATGIRVSELEHVTVEAISRGEAEVRCKGKTRTVLLTSGLCRLLAQYAADTGISSGSVFVTRGGRPMDRSNIWSSMKMLCGAAGVSAGKVYPHNLRHLFARMYYMSVNDIVGLAGILGHSSVETTRIYAMSSSLALRASLESLGLLECDTVK